MKFQKINPVRSLPKNNYGYSLQKYCFLFIQAISSQKNFFKIFLPKTSNGVNPVVKIRLFAKGEQKMKMSNFYYGVNQKSKRERNFNSRNRSFLFLKALNRKLWAKYFQVYEKQ